MQKASCVRVHVCAHLEGIFRFGFGERREEGKGRWLVLMIAKYYLYTYIWSDDYVFVDQWPHRFFPSPITILFLLCSFRCCSSVVVLSLAVIFICLRLQSKTFLLSRETFSLTLRHFRGICKYRNCQPAHEYYSSFSISSLTHQGDVGNVYWFHGLYTQDMFSSICYAYVSQTW
jgi:hypothetical protein